MKIVDFVGIDGTHPGFIWFHESWPNIRPSENSHCTMKHTIQANLNDPKFQTSFRLSSTQKTIQMTAKRKIALINIGGIRSVERRQIRFNLCRDKKVHFVGLQEVAFHS
jgi:hypothetical protein